MLGAYGWAFVKPIRKLYYNMTITFVSVRGRGGRRRHRGAGPDRRPARPHRPFWDVIGALNDNFGTIGYLIIAIFVVSWLIAAVVYRARGYHRLEAEVG